ncbi:MAG: GNAT family N-acetyltransferase [Candidatus Schekmanbacteria bacterium]|nr:MAG: GNAT family N-acetyltransferase [Candidatus Schekmanbacteria bacterium]
MQNRKIVIYEELSDDLLLKEIEYCDSENLRRWKNENREAFFYKETITAEMQKIWMDRYFKDSDNFMFIVRYKGTSIGVMGFKIVSEGAEIYNVILGKKEFGGQGIMGRAIRLMNGFILGMDINYIFLRVLSSNDKAIEWYKKNGFVDKGGKENYRLMVLDLNKFAQPKLHLEEY